MVLHVVESSLERQMTISPFSRSPLNWLLARHRKITARVRCYSFCTYWYSSRSSSHWWSTPSRSSPPSSCYERRRGTKPLQLCWDSTLGASHQQARRPRDQWRFDDGYQGRCCLRRTFETVSWPPTLYLLIFTALSLMRPRLSREVTRKEKVGKVLEWDCCSKKQRWAFPLGTRASISMFSSSIRSFPPILDCAALPLKYLFFLLEFLLIF